MRRSRKPFRASGSDEGSNPSPSAKIEAFEPLTLESGVTLLEVVLVPPAAVARNALTIEYVLDFMEGCFIASEN
jgi:hypothetical protein